MKKPDFMSKPAPKSLSEYPHRLTIPTRWADNDAYGHINNSVYYFYFDTDVNRFLIDNDLLEIGKSETVGLVVETACNYFAPVSFPDDIVAGLSVSKVGTSSVRYEIGLFKNDQAVTSAQGHFVHVYVNEATRRPAPISDRMRKALSRLTL